MVGLFFLGMFGALVLITWVIQKRRGETSGFYGDGESIDTRSTLARLSTESRPNDRPGKW